MSATADFNVTNLKGIQKIGVIGYRLVNGSFIFAWKDGGYHMMVLTTNDGTFLRAGALHNDFANTWIDPSSWKARANYEILNFRGFSKGLSHR